MKPLPNPVNFDHLKKQAKDLIRRFLRALPAAANRTPEEIVALGRRLHDVQSCVAREYGFASWTDLKSYVEAQSTALGDRTAAVHR